MVQGCPAQAPYQTTRPHVEPCYEHEMRFPLLFFIVCCSLLLYKASANRPTQGTGLLLSRRRRSTMQPHCVPEDDKPKIRGPDINPKEWSSYNKATHHKDHEFIETAMWAPRKRRRFLASPWPSQRVSKAWARAAQQRGHPEEANGCK